MIITGSSISQLERKVKVSFIYLAARWMQGLLPGRRYRRATGTRQTPRRFPVIPKKPQMGVQKLAGSLRIRLLVQLHGQAGEFGRKLVPGHPPLTRSSD
jgi:hypothetical protein